MEADKVIHNFNSLVGRDCEGRTNNLLSEGLSDAIAAMSQQVIEEGGKSKAKITLTVELTLDQGNVDVFMVPKIELPKPRKTRSTYWVTESNKLCTQDPRQPQLPLRHVAHDQGEVREIVG